MFNFTYYSPTKVVFGKETEAQVGALVKEQGCKKVLIHYGGGSVVRSGLLDRVKASLEAEGIAYVELGGVVPNPRVSKVREGVALCKQEGVDFVLAVGGGSVIDSGKAICYGALMEEDVWELFAHTRTATKCLPIGVVLTIAAAGSETSNDSVITNEETTEKHFYGNDIARPKFAIMNPELTMTLPDYQTACGAVDILMHTQERYFTNGGNMEMTDLIAEGLMRNVIANARILVKDPKNYDARAEMMWAGSLSHNGLTGCGNDGGDFASHVMEHEMGAMYDVAHGAGLAAIWNSWARYVYKDCLHRFVRFATNVMGVEAVGTDEAIALKGIEALEAFYRELNMPTNFRELGVEAKDEELREMARKAMEFVGGAQGSAKVLHEEDMYEIFKMAL